jgi:hypothetical protein
MYVIREVLRCKPGKVKELLERFKVISAALREMDHEPLRLLTDVAGGPFWTLVAEGTVEKIEDFLAAEEALRANAAVRQAMADYHALVDSGRREVYRLEG